MRRTRLRAILAMILVGVLLLGALFAAIASLNRDVYSAGGFVRQYLDALARHDADGATSLPGVIPSDSQLEAAGLPADIPKTLLRPSVLGSITDIKLLSDTETKPGLHSVEFGFTLNGEPAKETFAVERDGSLALVFDSWRFSTSPLATLRVSVLHESTFTVNGLKLDTLAHAAEDAQPSFSNEASYLAFAPVVYTLGHASELLDAAEQKVPVTAQGVTEVTIDAQPNATFVEQVQTELGKFLDECTAQQVLQPSNCPFGIVIDDRIKDLPVWSITAYPTVTLTTGETAFVMPDTGGAAHITVEVQSLFDGDIETRDEDVPFAVGLSVSINPGGSLAIQLH